MAQGKNPKTPKTQDKPVVQATLSSLIQEVETPEEYRMALPEGRGIITFPDLYAQNSEEAERTFAQLGRSATNWKVLRKWLSKKDADALAAENLSLAQLTHVVTAASNYYEDFYGTPGESHASES